MSNNKFLVEQTNEIIKAAFNSPTGLNELCRVAANDMRKQNKGSSESWSTVSFDDLFVVIYNTLNKGLGDDETTAI